MLAKGQPRAAIMALFDCDLDALQDGLEALQLPVAPDARWNRGPEKTRWGVPHIRELVLAWVQGRRVQPMAEHFGRKAAAVYAKARQMGLPKRQRARLQDGPLPLFDFASVCLDPPHAKDHAPVPAPVLLDWSGMVGAACQQPERLLLPDMEPEPVLAPILAPVPVPVEIVEPEPERPLPVLRRMSIPIPDACRGFKAPQTREEFDRFCRLMVGNTLGSIRGNLGGMDPSRREDAVQEVYLDLLEWFVGESPKFPGRPRYLNYDASKNLEFWQWYIRQIPYKTGEFFKGVKRERDAGVTFSTWNWDGDEEFDALDALVEGDTTASIAMRSTPVAAENVLDLGAFMRVASRISEHHAGTKAPRFRAAASFTSLIQGIQQGCKPEEQQSRLQDHVIHAPVSLNSVKSWTAELFAAARMFHARGSQGVLSHYGVPA